MANSRISDLQQKTVLHSTGVSDSADDEALFLIAREKSHNETINYKDLKNSVTDYCVTITGDQSIAGEKTFENNSFFQSDVDISGNLKVEGNLSVQGDIFNLKFDDGLGGDADQYLTQLDSNLVTKGNQEVDGDSTLKGNLSVSGQASISGHASLNTLETAGAADIYGDIGVSGDASLTNLSVSGPTILEGSLNTKGQTVLDQDLSVQGKIISPTVQGNTLLEGDLNTKGETVLEQNLQVQGVVTSPSVESAKLFINQPDITISADEDGDEEGNIIFNTSGAEQARIKGADFGIGTATPIKKLDVAGDINFSGDLYKGGTLLPIGEWNRAGANDIYFDRGNVGIGLTAPTQPLDVAGTIKSQGLEIDGDATITGKLLFSNHYSQETDLPSPSTYHGMFAHVHNTGRAYFSHAGEWLPLLNMTADGKVGIGTIFPDEALHVEGNIKLIGDILGLESFTASGTLTALDINAQNDVNIQNDLNILTDGILTLHGVNSKIVAPKIEAGDIEADQIEITGEHLTVSGIDSKVGIGTSDPDDDTKLHVVGNSKFEGSILESLAVESGDGSLKLDIAPNVISHTKDNGGLTISAEGTDNDLILRASGDIKLVDQGNNAKLTIDGATGNTSLTGDLSFSGKIYNDGVEFSGGPIKSGDTFNGAVVVSPATSSAIGVKGDFLFDDEYAYICVADSDGNDASKKAWKRFPISDW